VDAPPADVAGHGMAQSGMCEAGSSEAPVGVISTQTRLRSPERSASFGAAGSNPCRLFEAGLRAGAHVEPRAWSAVAAHSAALARQPSPVNHERRLDGGFISGQQKHSCADGER
jgi:hypothetical protein